MSFTTNSDGVKLTGAASGDAGQAIEFNFGYLGAQKTALAGSIASHVANTSNPHSVTKAQVGLGSVANSLQLVAANNLSDLASASAARTNLGLGTAATAASSAFDTAGAASTVQGNLTTHVADTGNPHGVTKTQVGLGNVSNNLQLAAANNLSDLVSVSGARTNLGLGTAATQNSTAFDTAGAASTVQSNLTTHTGNTSNPHGVTAAQVGAYTTSAVDSALALKAPISGPTFTGNLTVNDFGASQIFQVDTSGNGVFSGTITGTSFSGSGASLTALNAGNLSSGTVNDARLPATMTGKTFSGAVVCQKRITSAGVALIYSATLATDASLGNQFNVTLTGNVTLANPTNPVDGQGITWCLLQDATGGRTVTLDTAFNDPTTAVSKLRKTASKREYLSAVYNSASSLWDVMPDLGASY